MCNSVLYFTMPHYVIESLNWNYKDMAFRTSLVINFIINLNVAGSMSLNRSQWYFMVLNTATLLERFAISGEMFITRDSEVIMFSACVFVCLCVCVYVCHDVCPDDLTMKDWCHTNYILQVHWRGCLVVQVMFHALMTSLMTSQGHKVGQILKLIYLRQYLS